ncbi:ferritin-like domain-containing protein [Thiohalobacter sp.]|uniref:ferritin-like domain-containing protein n=1 Tax=Thiohalobacter sp. TaxID=2025948 RepID=UPI00262C01EE|nr:ferritin-like domain-containing protein [Thiohalobacter sp.]
MPAFGMDPRILGYLGRALSLELSAVQNYSTQARLAETWGLADAARRFKTEAAEELGHVERVIGRMLALGAAPNASMLRPAGVGRNLRELLEFDHAFENDLVDLYSDAVAYSSRIGDADSRVFFEGLLAEEKAHARELQTWLAELEVGAAV